MRLPAAAVLFLCCVALQAQQKNAALSDKEKQKLDTLFEKLASDDFLTRKQAAKNLRKLLLHLNAVDKTDALRRHFRQKMNGAVDAETKVSLGRLWVIVKFGITEALLEKMPDLPGCLTSSSAEKRLEAVDRLADLVCSGLDDAGKPLIALLEDADEDVRTMAAEALAGIGSREAAKPLIQALNDGDASVRLAAVKALGALGAGEAAATLVAKLKDENGDVRAAAAYALGETGAKKAVKPLIAALADISPDVREAAASALGNIGAEEAAHALVKALEDKEYQVWDAAMAALRPAAMLAPAFRSTCSGSLPAAAHPLRIENVSSVEPPSTITTSSGGRLWAASEASRRSMVGPSFSTVAMTDTFTVPSSRPSSSDDWRSRK